ncbi:hypothetical protein SAY87_024934 [Trapa incisa]|uniref:P53 and DNA damage-regulated protein 1 n=2 Tax=Trapa TaxID=22665 RepID=A0AAN7LZL0_TRANT|nr:hypothetical protein SAY87_024934 [Trapa incisa]KAK4789143.1 hypothetical protein SAY86_020462 [Trapa natans]
MEVARKKYRDLLFGQELEAERLLLAKAQQQEIGKLKEGNRQAQSALRRRARTTKTSVPTPFESIMMDIGESRSKPLVHEVCRTCGDHNSNECTWMMFPGTDLFSRIPFHATHKILEEDEPQLNFEYNKLQSYIKETSLSLSEKGALSDMINSDVLRSLVTLKGKSSKSTADDDPLI